MKRHCVLLTQGAIGKSTLDVVLAMLGRLPIPTSVLYDDPNIREPFSEEIERLKSSLSAPCSLIVITDIRGSSAYQEAEKLAKKGKIILLTGLNLAMLLRFYQNHQSSLHTLVEETIEGAQKAIAHIPMEATLL